MTALLLLNLAMALWVLGVSYNQATHNALAFYNSTLITMCHAAAAAAAALMGLLVRRFARLFLMASSIALIALPLSCEVSVSGYPGGDDGGSLGWMFYVGGSVLFSMAVGAVTGIMGLICNGDRLSNHRRA